MLSHVFTILLTRCPVLVPCFCADLLQKVTSGNILEIGQKFTTIFYWTNEDRSQKADPGRYPQPWGWSHPRVRGGPRAKAVCAPRAPSRPPPTPIKSSQTKKTYPLEVFPKDGTELRCHRRQVSGVQKILFRHPAGTGIDGGLTPGTPELIVYQ